MAVTATVTDRHDGQGDCQPSESAQALDLIRDQQQTILELSGRLGFVTGQLEEARTKIALLEAPAPVEPTAEIPNPAPDSSVNSVPAETESVSGGLGRPGFGRTTRLRERAAALVGVLAGVWVAGVIPTFTPAETMAIEPRPLFVSYQ